MAKIKSTNKTWQHLKSQKQKGTCIKYNTFKVIKFFIENHIHTAVFYFNTLKTIVKILIQTMKLRKWQRSSFA